MKPCSKHKFVTSVVLCVVILLLSTTIFAYTYNTGQSNKVAMNELKSIKEATVYDLEQLPSIGEKSAQEIVNYVANNDIKSLEELRKIPQIGDVKIKIIKEYYRE